MAFSLNAQVKASGVVYDENNDPVIGATVVQKGKTSNGIATDIDGKFTLPVPSGAKLVVTYLGYEPMEVAAKSDMTVVHGRSYYVSKTNGLVPAGNYAFDADGKMILN